MVSGVESTLLISFSFSLREYHTRFDEIFHDENLLSKRFHEQWFQLDSQCLQSCHLVHIFATCLAQQANHFGINVLFQQLKNTPGPFYELIKGSSVLVQRQGPDHRTDTHLIGIGDDVEIRLTSSRVTSGQTVHRNIQFRETVYVHQSGRRRHQTD